MKQKYAVQLGLLGKIRIHPLFVVLVLLAVGVGLWKDVTLLFLIVMLHELGHAVTAEHFGYEIEQISLLPYGGVAKLSHRTLGFHPQHEALIAIAGPAVNLLLALLTWALFAAGICSESFFRVVVQLNVWIAVFNLLPALPLDGGRILRAARSRIVGYESATLEVYRVAYAIAFCLLVLGGFALWSGSPHIGVLLLGVFLLAGAYTGRRDLRMDTVRFLDAKKRQQVRKSEMVRALAAPSSVTVKDIVKQFAPDRYHMIYVLGKNGSVETIVEEDELLEAVFAGRWMDRLDVWLQRDE